jgi:hypothetical protein
MPQKLFNTLLLFSLFGVAMAFFGNLYEAVVIGPNMLEDTVQKMGFFQNFFVATNPAFFYVPVTQLAIITLVVSWLMAPKHNATLKRQLKFAVTFQLLSVVLSVYIITQINLKLFFGDLSKFNAVEIHAMAVQWNILNMVRIIIIAVSLTFLFKGYVQNQQKPQQ